MFYLNPTFTIINSKYFTSNPNCVSLIICRKTFYLNPSRHTEYKIILPVQQIDSHNNSSNNNESCNCKDHQLIHEELNKLKIFCATLFKKFVDLQKTMCK